MNEAAVVAAAAQRPPLLLPGTSYLPNRHIDAIVYQLMRVHAGEIPRPPHQPATALTIRVRVSAGQSNSARQHVHRSKRLRRHTARYCSPS
jgi:hypothetical protein